MVAEDLNPAGCEAPPRKSNDTYSRISWTRQQYLYHVIDINSAGTTAALAATLDDTSITSCNFFVLLFPIFSNFIETSRGKIWILEECCQNCESVLKISKHCQAKFFIIQVIISFASLLETLRPPRQTWTGRRPRPGRANATWRRRGTCEAPWSLGVLRIQCFLTCKLLRPRAFKKLTVRDLFPD